MNANSQYRLPQGPYMNCCSPSSIPTFPKGKKMACVVRKDICGRAIKHPSLVDWLFIPYLSSVAHQFLPNQGESKRIRQSFLVLIKENHTIILLYKFCFLKRELSFLGLIYPVFICSIRISLELPPPVVQKSNIQGP